jgi:hypothetical protein
VDKNEVPELWTELLTFQSFNSVSEYDDEAYVPELSDRWVDTPTLEGRRQQRMERRREATMNEDRRVKLILSSVSKKRYFKFQQLERNPKYKSQSLKGLS